jgi:hypothetical protein
VDIETKSRDMSVEETTEFTYGDHAIRRRGNLLNLTSMWVAQGDHLISNRTIGFVSPKRNASLTS